MCHPIRTAFNLINWYFWKKNVGRMGNNMQMFKSKWITIQVFRKVLVAFIDVLFCYFYFSINILNTAEWSVYLALFWMKRGFIWSITNVWVAITIMCGYLEQIFHLKWLKASGERNPTASLSSRCCSIQLPLIQ